MTSTDAGSSHTDWAMIATASHTNAKLAARAMEQLLRRYWPAVYAFIRSSGRDVHEAADLTQGFICDVVLRRQLIQRADPERGRFRSLLLTAVQNYLRERHRHERRGRAGQREQHVNVDHAAATVTDFRADQTPEAAFSSQWSATLVRQVLDHVRRTCERDQMDAHWTVFDHRVVRPMLTGEPPTEYRRLVNLLDLDDPAQAANMAITVKRRFVRALLAEIGRTVGSPGEVQDELRALLRDLERA